MDATERTEVREMIHDVLDGWNQATIQREKLILLSLNNIDSHLDKLNGKVAAHEKTILENLPHNVSHCTQTENIEELKAAIISHDSFKSGEESASGKKSIADTLAATNRRDRRFVAFQVIALTLTLAGLIWAIYMGSVTRKDMVDVKGETKITNEILIPPGKSRGDYYDPFKNDTLK